MSCETPVTSVKRSEKYEKRRSSSISQNQSDEALVKSRNRVSLALRSASTRLRSVMFSTRAKKPKTEPSGSTLGFNEMAIVMVSPPLADSACS